MIFIVLLILGLLIVIGIPIAVSLGLTGLFFLIKESVPLSIIPSIMFSGMENFVFLAMPLFMVAGEIMNRGRIAEDLVELASSLVGALRGGLAMVNIAASMIFAEISGSAVADVASLGVILIPAMEKRGYPGPYAAAITAASASIAIMIPPSLAMILYGAIANVSVVKLFIAGILPGVIYGGFLMIMSFIFAVLRGWPPDQKFSLLRLARAFRRAMWALTLPIIILGGILGGIFTATEAGAMAVAAALFIGLVIKRSLRPSDLPGIILLALKRTSIILLMVATSLVFGWYLSNKGIPQKVAVMVMEISGNAYIVMFFLNIFLIFLHTFLHGTAGIVLTVPLILPLAEQLGYDPLHFGLILVMNTAIGQQTPPVASVVIATSAISGCSIGEIMKYNKWFLLILFIVLQLVTYLPWIGLWLPSVLAR